MNTSSIINSISKHLRYGSRLNPMRDWLVLLTVSAVALIGIVIWNVWTFNVVASGGTIGSPTASTIQPFNQSSLDTIRTVFANREAEEEKYEKGTYSFADPSQ